MDVQRGLVERIEALRLRLQGLSDEPSAGDGTSQRLHQLLDQFLQVQSANEHLEERLAALLRGELGQPAPERLPVHLAYRARRLLLRARSLLDQLRDVAADLPTPQESAAPVWNTYRQAVSMAELALRSVQSFPDGTANQLSLCDGFEAMLDRIEEAARQVAALAKLQKTDEERLHWLGQALLGLVQNRPLLPRTLYDLADRIQQEARDGQPPRLVNVRPGQPELWAAAQGLNVAQIIARLGTGHDLGTTTRLDAVVAGLVHDAGMAALPVAILEQATPLDDDQRRQIETHVGLALEGLRRVMPAEGWLLEGVRTHHERLDGTGYPSGKKGPEIARLARLLALVDVYVGVQSDRPFRPARSPKVALTEALLGAERGQLDGQLAECLLELSFYPVGSVVELSDGRIGVVIATQYAKQDLLAPAKPVVRILASPEGVPTPLPAHVNLAQCDGVHVVRSLTRVESEKMLASRFLSMLAAA